VLKQTDHSAVLSDRHQPQHYTYGFRTDNLYRVHITRKVKLCSMHEMQPIAISELGVCQSVMQVTCGECSIDGTTMRLLLHCCSRLLNFILSVYGDDVDILDSDFHYSAGMEITRYWILV